MKRSILGFSGVAVMLAAIATIATADDAKEAAINKDRKQIEGTWRVISLVIDGKKSTEEDARKLTVVNGADGTWILRADDKEINRGIPHEESQDYRLHRDGRARQRQSAPGDLRTR